MKFHSTSSLATKTFASAFASALLARFFGRKNRKQAFVVALSGDLGAGKTTFVQGFLRFLHIRSRIISPTFVLMKHYQGFGFYEKKKYPLDFYHLDCYRITDVRELDTFDFSEIIRNPNAIILIEWPERIASALPTKDVFWLKFSHGKTEHSRIFETSLKILVSNF